MLEEKELQKIKETIERFFQLATILPLKTEVFLGASQGDDKKDVVNVVIRLSEPQILIGEKGQTLFELQRILKMILNKKIQKNFYLDLDINDYKKKKSEYLKDIAKDLADEVAFTKREKVLVPMSPYERRIIHAELAQRLDITTESQGEGENRHIIIKPKSE